MGNPTPFEDYLASEFMKEYHGDKEHYMDVYAGSIEDAFDGWLANLDVSDVIEYGNQAMKNTITIS
jgi:hypothetical protein